MKKSKVKFDDVLSNLKLDFEVESSQSWLVLARFMKESLDSIEITTQLLRHFKSKLSELTNIPFNSLEYAETLENREIETFIFATFRIKVTDEQKGNPQITFLPFIASDGVEYKDMIARLTIHPMLEDGSQVNMERIRALLKRSRIQENLFQWDVIDNQLEKTISKNISQMAVVATGIIPSSGKNAEIEFYVDTCPDPSDESEFQNTLRVSSGKLICKKNPKTQSETSGTDLFGNVVEGVPGFDIELEAGEGATCSAQGLAIYALRDGVAQIQTYVRPVVTANVLKNVLCKVSASVVPLRVLTSENKINLTTNDAIEVRGNLKSGSNISSSSSIIVAGSIEGQGYLSSGSSIIVQGNVYESNLVSKRDTSIRGSIFDTSVISKEQTQIGGSIVNSKVFSDRAMHVNGNVDDQSIVVSADTVAVTGNVNPHCHIESQDDIIVQGNVGNSELVGDKNITITGMITDGVVSAKKLVAISGSVINTNIVAESIIAENASGGTLIANNSIKVNSINDAPDDKLTEIKIGISHYSEKRLEQNQISISNAEQSVDKLGQYFGSDVLQQIEIDNIHGALIQFMKSVRNVTNTAMSSEEVTTSRRLLESIKPARDMISERKYENLILTKKAEKSNQQIVRLEIDGEITGKAKVNLNGCEVELTAANKGNIVITNDLQSNSVDIKPIEHG